MPHKQGKIRLAKGIRKYIRRQKMIIKRLAKDKDEERRLIRELLDRFYKPKTKTESANYSQ